MHGIFNLTREPKLEVAIPTENAKNKENKVEKSSNGFFPIIVKKPKNLSLTNKKSVSNIIYVFSRADNNITGLRASHK